MRFFAFTDFTVCFFCADRDSRSPAVEAAELLTHQYQKDKIALIGEVARLYWERIVMYQLLSGWSGLEWTDLIRREPRQLGDPSPTAKEKLCFKLAKSRNPEIDPELITTVFHYIREFGLPEPHIPVSVFEVPFLADKLDTFKFTPGDPHKKMAKRMCKAIRRNLELQSVPEYESLQMFLTEDALANDIYVDFAHQRRIDLTTALPTRRIAWERYSNTPKK